ncbi:restriction endonuclease subunit S [Vibrio splendidus]
MTGRYKAYPDYKSSGVFWLDKIPSNWTINTVKRLTDFQVGWTPPTGNDKNFVGDNLWANISDLKDKYLHNTAKNISDEAARLASMDITPKGSLLYSFKLSVGSVSFAQQDMYTNEAIASFLSSSKLPLEYLYYSLPIFVIQNASTNIYGARILNQELIKNAFLLEPSYEEAEKIANFLDHETAKIDTLITKQEKLIELLKEKRQAVISHAVTKGLNPDAPMKDSGIEWLGEVPEHWELPKLIQLTSRIGDGLHSTPRYADNTGYYFINGNNLKNGSIVISNTAKEVPEDEYKQHAVSLGGNSVFLSINGTIGSVALYNNEPIILGKSAAYINCETRLTPNFLMHFLQSSSALRYYELEATGTTISNLSLNSIRQMKVCLPAPKEQQNISEYCESQNKKYDALIGKAESLIKLIGERKTALISAAVTGKIDVRHWKIEVN